MSLPLLAIAGPVIALKWSGRRPRNWMHDLMAPEVDRGTVTADELTASSGSHHDRKQYLRHAKGHRSHVHARHTMAAATDLAKQLARADGADSPDVEFARREVARFRG